MGTACICYKDQNKAQFLLPMKPSDLQGENESVIALAGENKKRFMDIRNDPDEY